MAPGLTMAHRGLAVFLTITLNGTTAQRDYGRHLWTQITMVKLKLGTLVQHLASTFFRVSLKTTHAPCTKENVTFICDLFKIYLFYFISYLRKNVSSQAVQGNAV